MSRIKSICSIDGCNNEINHKEAGLCSNCYSFMWYWTHNGKTPRDIISHGRKLTVRQNRIDALMPSNVVRTSKRSVRAR